jgi:hypothetical protein
MHYQLTFIFDTSNVRTNTITAHTVMSINLTYIDKEALQRTLSEGQAQSAHAWSIYNPI